MANQVFKICSKCGQRCTPTMPACGRCFTPFPAPNQQPFPNQNPNLNANPNQTQFHYQPVKPRPAKWMVPLVVGIGILTTIIVAFIMLSKPHPLVGTWYGHAGRVVTFGADGKFSDDFHGNYFDSGHKPPRRYIVSGATFQVFNDGAAPNTFHWSMNLDNQSINLEEGASFEVLFRTPPPDFPSPKDAPTNTGSGSGSTSGTGGGAEIVSPGGSNTVPSGGTSDAGITLQELADRQNARMNKYRNP